MEIRWPETPFKESMLGSNVVIHCPDGELVEDLFEIFRAYGMEWLGGEPLSCTHWEKYESSTCYRVFHGNMLMFGTPSCYPEHGYDDYVKCTFYGSGYGIEVSDAEFEAIIRGVSLNDRSV